MTQVPCSDQGHSLLVVPAMHEPSAVYDLTKFSTDIMGPQCLTPVSCGGVHLTWGGSEVSGFSLSSVVEYPMHLRPLLQHRRPSCLREWSDTRFKQGWRWQRLRLRLHIPHAFDPGTTKSMCQLSSLDYNVLNRSILSAAVMHDTALDELSPAFL